MSYIPQIQNTLDPNNSSTTVLAANASFTGTGTNVTRYQSIYVTVFSTQASATNGLTIQFSQDNVNWVTSSSLTVTASQNLSTTINISAQYFRIVYTNGGTLQTTFRLQTCLQVTTTVMAARINALQDSGAYVPLSSDANQNLNIAIANPISGFGDISEVQIHPHTQVNFLYGLNGNQMTGFNVSSGTVTSTGQMVVLTSGTTSGGTATAQSLNRLPTRGGQGSTCRFSALFTTGVASTTQIAGIGDAVNGYFFGYNGIAFGIATRVNSVTTWVAQTAWNNDVMDGSNGLLNPSGVNLVPTDGNIYQIKFQYLGFGSIFFFVMSPSNGTFQLVHIIKYPNANTTVQLTNSSLPLLWQSTTASTSSVIVKTAGGALMHDGLITLGSSGTYGTDNNKTTITTLTSILTLKNVATFNTFTNNGQITLRYLSVNTPTTATMCVCRLILNGTLGGTPAYTNINSINSIAAVDTAGTTVTNGIVKFSATFGVNGNLFLDLSKYKIYLNPNDIISVACVSSASASISVALTWSEDL